MKNRIFGIMGAALMLISAAGLSGCSAQKDNEEEQKQEPEFPFVSMIQEEGTDPEVKGQMPDNLDSYIITGYEKPVQCIGWPDDSVSIYGISGEDDSQSVMIDWDGVRKSFGWNFFNTRGPSVESYFFDADGDGEDELVVTEVTGTGTGISVTDIHIVEKDGEELKAFTVPEELAEQAAEKISVKTSDEGLVFSMEGSEDVLYPCDDPESFGTELLTGYIVNYEIAYDEIHGEYGVCVEDGLGMPAYPLSIKGALRYSDGKCSLEDMSIE